MYMQKNLNNTFANGRWDVSIGRAITSMALLIPSLGGIEAKNIETIIYKIAYVRFVLDLSGSGNDKFWVRSLAR